MLPIVECPEERSLSQLLGIPMHSLWHVLICCKLAKKTKGIKGANLFDRKAFAEFITTHGLGNMVVLDEKDKQPVLRMHRHLHPTQHSYGSLRVKSMEMLPKNGKPVDILKVLNYNDSTISLVEVPCSAKQSGFKHQAR
jgi:hypothetical protein